MEVEILLDCGHIILVPVENVLSVPGKGTEIRCSICKSPSLVRRVGTPYHVTHEPVDNTGQKSILNNGGKQ